MDKEYKPKKIEEDIQAYWDKSNSFKTDFTNKKISFIVSVCSHILAVNSILDMCAIIL